MEKVALYCTELINNNDKINNLVETFIYMCKNRNKNYDYTVFCDRVKSRNSTENRPKLEELKKDIKNNVYKKIIILNLKNLSRDTIFILDFISFIEKQNCKLISMDGIDPHKTKNFYDKAINDIKQNKKI